MDINGLIIKTVKKHKTVKVVDITKATGFSRAYIGRFFNALKNEGKIVLLGKANKAVYAMATRAAILAAKKELHAVVKVLKNVHLNEDTVLNSIKDETGIFLRLPKSVSTIVTYAFTEMMNNAIEHSESDLVRVKMADNTGTVEFTIADRGVGIFQNIMKKRGLKNELEAIQDLLKGKQTTAPKEHTGEGIFFTSKAADRLTISSSNKKLIFDNRLNDVFIKDIKPVQGTKVTFALAKNSTRELDKIFRAYTNDAFGFSATAVTVDLYKMDTDYISRSQARRLLSGLEKFKTVLLDFKNVETVGQAFADEVFRVWHRNHRQIAIAHRNANENIEFMIRRAKAN